MGLDLNVALMCSEASDAVYYEWNECSTRLAKYIDKQYITKTLDSNGAQAFCFKLNASTGVITFRGTDPDINDVIADIMAWHSESDTQGDVHTGFKRELDKIYLDVLSWIKSRAVNKDTLLYITGHSLGGAMAQLCAARLKRDGYNVVLYTFGAPRSGNKEWAAQFDNIPAYRFVNCNDIVTRVPPFGFYQHVGQLMYLTYDGDLLTKSTWLQRIKDKTKGIYKAWRKGEPFSSVYDHETFRYIKKIKELNPSKVKSIIKKGA